MKLIRVIKAGSIQKDIEKIVNQNLSYDYMGDKGMVNPSPLLKKYENMYEAIRPKDIDYGAYDGIGYIKYVSQGCDDADAMFNMIFEAISKNPTLEKMYQDGKFTIQVCSRDNWGQWTTFTNSEKEELDLDQLIEDAEYLFDNEEDSDLLYEFADFMGVSVEKTDNIDKMIRQNPEKAEKFIRQYIN